MKGLNHILRENFEMTHQAFIGKRYPFKRFIRKKSLLTLTSSVVFVSLAEYLRLITEQRTRQPTDKFDIF